MCSGPRSFKKKESVWEIVCNFSGMLFNLLLGSDVSTYNDET